MQIISSTKWLTFIWSLSSILILQLSHVDSSSSMNTDEFKNLKDLWWSLSNKVNDSRQVWFLIDWRSKDFVEAWDSVNWWDRDWFTEHCLFFRFKTFSCSSMIISSWVSIVVWLISSSSSLLMWSTWTLIYCSLSFKVMSHWSLSSISILMILSDWLIVHWRSCWSVLMFHEIVTFWDFAEALKEIRKTHLLAMLLSRWTVRDSTDSESRVIVRKIRVDWVIDLINLSKFADVFWWK